MRAKRTPWPIRNHALAGLLALAFCTDVPGAALGASATLTVQADQPGVAISSNLFGIFFEEINSAGDGGLYAELVRNRSFEDSATNANYWSLVTSGSAAGQMSIDTSLPLSPTNTQSLKLVFQSGTGTVGAANNGYWGVPLTQGATYDLGFYARSTAGYGGTLWLSLESGNGGTVYAQTAFTGLGTGWQQYRTSLAPNATDPAARLVLRINQPGTVWLDYVSLFPRATWNHRTNGLRADLANMLLQLNPSFVRFPGGSWVDGTSIANAYHWQPTIGDPANRVPRWNLWGYNVDNGLGYHEYLQMCEDLGAAPLFVINCGMDVSQNAVPLAQMNSWVQEVLDGIQYANGDTNSVWGAQRAANGHPAPFHLQFVEIGNENGGSAYNDRYTLFYDAIKAAYPDVHIIANVWGGIPSARPVELMDEHYYSDPGFFIRNATRYDTYNRSGPKVYVGEYAVTSGSGNGNLAGALGEAAFMTGLERNADIVAMASYAPLFANLNNKNWNPDLIYFTGTQVYGTPSYYVQQMFSQNRGDVTLPVSLTVTGDTNQPPHGAIGLGSWNTQVQYTNVVVSSNGVTLYQSDFTSGAGEWKVYNGTWSTAAGLYQQTALITDCRSTTGGTNWSNYTISLRARKTGGNEGFLILFNWLDDNNWTWWNIGGWNNTQHAIEQMVNGSKSIIGGAVAGSVTANQWYDIRIVLTGPRIQCYLNNQLIHDTQYPGAPHGAVGLGTWNTQSSYSNVVVTAAGGQNLYQSDFTAGTSGWQVYNGTWSTSGGLYQQTAITTDCRATTGDTNWSDYTLTLKARKDGGNEGFLILFNWQDNNNWTWWNIGGWNNTQHAIEQMVNGTKSILGSAVPGSVQAGRWYDIRIVLSGSRIQCYLDGQLVHDVSYGTSAPLLASASYVAGRGQVILKAVNVLSQPITTQFGISSARGLDSHASLTVLTSTSPTDENSLAQPTKVFPITSTLPSVANSFTYTLPANSLAVFRLQSLPDFPVGIGFAMTNQQNLTALSNGITVRLSSFITNTVSVDYTIDCPEGLSAGGTLQFVPGALAQTVTVPGDVQSCSLVRVTLSNPTDGQLQGPTRVYYVPTLNTSTQAPVLAWARFPDETVLYWSDSSAAFLESTSVYGPWQTLTNVPSPFHPDLNRSKGFYRLMR